MSSQSRPSYYTLSTTDGHQATLYVPPDDDPWQAATQYAHISFASDSQLAALRIASQAEIAAFTAQLPGAPLEPALPPEPGSDAVPPGKALLGVDQPPRGAKINVGWLGRGPHNHPAWASRPQQETWRSGVLVVWDQDRQRIIGLSASQALRLLADIQSCDQWPQEGIILGVPMTRLVLNQPDRPPEDVLADQIELSPAETAALLELLRSHKDALHAQAEAEEADIRRRLGQIYTLLLNAAAKRRARLAQEAEPAQSNRPLGPSPTPHYLLNHLLLLRLAQAGGRVGRLPVCRPHARAAAQPVGAADRYRSSPLDFGCYLSSLASQYSLKRLVSSSSLLTT